MVRPNFTNTEFELGGINHVAMVCSDMERTVDFYNNVLGMPLIKAIDLPDDGERVVTNMGLAFTTLTVASQNLSAAESRLRDLDYAKEMMNFVRIQILVQANNSMMAQANQLPRNVLALLGQ